MLMKDGRIRENREKLDRISQLNSGSSNVNVNVNVKCKFI